MSEQAGDQARRSVAAIPAEQNVPPDVADDLSAKEEIDLSAGKRATYLHRQMVSLLRAELATAQRELDRLRPIEVESSRLSQAHRSHRFVLGITSLAMVVGGGLVSTFQWRSEPVYFAIGWTLIAVCGILQLCKTVLDL